MKRVLLFLVIIFSISCSSAKFFTSDVNPAEINEMIKIEPFTYISLVESGNRTILNDSISKISKILLNESLDTFREKLRLSSEDIIVTNSVDRAELEQEIDFLIMWAEGNINKRKKKRTNVEIPLMIDYLLRTNDKRFGLIVVQQGFTRAKGNYSGQVAKAIGMGILTGVATGTAYYQTPIKANSILYAMIVDTKEKNVAFYNKSVLQDKEPTVKENITKQLQFVFENYFWDKNK